MHVREWGSPEGRPLVFWHALGAGTSGAYLTEVAPTLTDAGLWLLAPDAPGFGESPALPPERYEIGSVLDLLRGVLDERGIDRALLMGHSWGGTVAMAFAAAEPDRVEGLVLLDTGQMDYQDQPGFPHGKSLGELIEAASAPERQIRVAGWEAFEADAQQEIRRPVTPELLEALKAGVKVSPTGREILGIVTPEVRGAVMHGIMGTRVTETWPTIAAAGIPILLLLATEPPEAREQTELAEPIFSQQFPDAEIHSIESAGHDLLADAGPELGRLVAHWVRRLPAHEARALRT